MPALPLTPDQQADALRLKNVYESRKAALGITQDSLAAACGWESQGTVSQYMNGKIPLNLDAALKFAVALRCSIEDFSPSLAETLKRSGYMKRDSVLSSNGHLAGLSGATESWPLGMTSSHPTSTLPTRKANGWTSANSSR